MVILWNLIRDFYVQYIFGGITSTRQQFSSLIGSGRTSAGNYNDIYSITQFLPVGNTYNGDTLYMSMGDWLSSTATIITLIVLVVILFLMLRWLFKVVSGLILLRN